ncbi:hypothetical protein AZ19_1132 [Bordetella bronchiseptica E012]|uniref:Uncharacterized protein n=1 Tax=Bordetella bronchiseptica 00-P-2796 TaxID=1331199 RepID=A0ABR4RG79_BORBO|nr:hypothetical protein L490_0860 [Bordetella bronchiseptica 00-P-2796]KDB95959.1 hypothetical protein AZ23_1118 [Bordetella bronchiseptica E010]KDC01445.1 hypothetical protein AZ18_1103 [Bordetella bronchiseptica D993]KDC08280.1 hypothetical protein AZ24_1117 [Bordetella bronchiseptica E013]KDC09345.1 hypothetical protein AZ19_1132 [Bordetella bronchiseptica E012]KDC66221.1 hypothetical protein L512_1133 [Bordetella bronchiseptica MBORD624]KDD26137.1 hypothetical protein L525_1105 [Bordetell
MCCCVHVVREKGRDAAPVRVGVHAHPPASWPAGAAARRAWVGDNANCPRGRAWPPAGIGATGLYLGISRVAKPHGRCPSGDSRTGACPSGDRHP